LRLLLDTHVVLWWLDEEERIPPSVQAQLAAPDNVPFVSVVSLWEIAVKRAVGKLNAPDDLRPQLADQGFGELDVTGDHAWAVAELPLHHRDPFDRLLVAQAKLEKLVLVTADERLRAYGVPIIW
jgi:PIN domain nuclease of toxin-antitoxin system